MQLPINNLHWRRSALNSAGALQSGGGEFRGIFTPFYTINFRGLCKTGGARAPAAPPSSAPMKISLLLFKVVAISYSASEKKSIINNNK